MATRCASTSLFFLHVLYLLSEAMRLGTSERAADVDGDSKVDENGDLFAFTPTLRNESIKPTKVRPPVTSENSAEITGAGVGR